MVTIGAVAAIALLGLLIVKNNQLQGQVSSAQAREVSVSKAAASIEKRTPASAVTSSKAETTATDTSSSKSFEKDEATVKKFFDTMFNYTSATYLPRFDQATAYAEAQPIQLLIGTGGKPQQPPTSISSKLIDFGFFPEYQAASSVNQNGTYSAIVAIKFHFNYQGQDTDTGATYKLTIDRNSGKISEMWVRNEQGDYR